MDNHTCKELDPASCLSADDYGNAMLSQTACNLSGIIRSAAKVTEAIWAEARRLGKGTDWVNKHPIMRLYAEQISHLAKGDLASYGEASEICETLSKQLPRPTEAAKVG